MHGMEQILVGPGRGFGQEGLRVLEGGGHLEPWGIAGLVLGILLWAAVMTVLVMLMITLVRHLKRGGKTPAEAHTTDTATTEALKSLDERYVRGEIDSKEYVDRKGHLTKP